MPMQRVVLAPAAEEDKAVGTVLKPRHFLLFRVSSNREIEIGRVLHDSMDLASNLPDEYLP